MLARAACLELVGRAPALWSCTCWPACCLPATVASPPPYHTLLPLHHCSALQEASTLDLVIAGTSEAVLMIEGFCDFLTEEQMLEVGGGVEGWLGALVRCSTRLCGLLQCLYVWREGQVQQVRLRQPSW